ncbi:hypothetical protein [Clostridium sardiniense]|uniref:hypothetical protein n=1 Tax=Clostridium sardiniense TaxID=29369 RepID=UPI00195919F8|nr:hypothetical protein [Clostridium sardiniense]MBM7833863.1 tetratricopeptide (TPR) repeat protein [Clostridium sardiniense]
MQKKKLIVIILGICAIAVIGGFSFNYYRKETKFSNYISTANKLISDGNYSEATSMINEAKEIKDSTEVKEAENLLKLTEEQSKIYDEGLNLAKQEKYTEAINVLEKIDSNATQIKDKANKEIASLKNKLISTYVDNATKFIDKSDFTNANKEIDKIASINSNDSNIQKLKDSIDSKKKELVATYKSKATEAIKNNNFNDANKSINKLQSIGANDEAIKSLKSKLTDKEKTQKYYNCRYRGISDTQKQSTMYFAAAPSKPCITRYYNPDLMTEKIFIDFYHANIEPKLYEGYSYVLRSTKDNNYGLLFVCEPNENYEFNMGKIGPDGLLDIYSDSAAYCGIHGDKVVYYSLQTQQPIGPLLLR